MTITEYAATLKAGDPIYIQHYGGWNVSISQGTVDKVTPTGWIKSGFLVLRPDDFEDNINKASLMLPDEGKNRMEERKNRNYVEARRRELVGWLHSGNLNLTKETIERLMAIKEEQHESK